METTIVAPISITPSAVTEFKNLLQGSPSGKEQYLRIGVKGGGCSGMSYILGFDDPQESDLLFEIDGVQCAINKNHLLYIQGLEIDWHNDLNARGFVFNNPNASSSCGCGSSFSV
ncbi:MULTISPECIES: HesB/IscA family protein [Chitinophagaceae]